MDWTGLTRFSTDLALPLMFIRGSKGLLVCGYFNIETFDRTGEASALVRGVNTFDEMAAAEIQSVSAAASELGVQPGMTGQQALELLR